MKKTTNETTALVKMAQLETEICFEIVELEEDLLSTVTSGTEPPTTPPIVVNICPNWRCN